MAAKEAMEMALAYWESVRVSQQVDFCDLLDDQNEASEDRYQPVLNLSSRILESAKKLSDTEIIINQITKINDNGNTNNE